MSSLRRVLNGQRVQLKFKEFNPATGDTADAGLIGIVDDSKGGRSEGSYWVRLDNGTVLRVEDGHLLKLDPDLSMGAAASSAVAAAAGVAAVAAAAALPPIVSPNVFYARLGQRARSHFWDKVKSKKPELFIRRAHHEFHIPESLFRDIGTLFVVNSGNLTLDQIFAEIRKGGFNPITVAERAAFGGEDGFVATWKEAVIRLIIEFLSGDNQRRGGSYYEKYLKYKNKYISLKDSFAQSI